MLEVFELTSLDILSVQGQKLMKWGLWLVQNNQDQRVVERLLKPTTAMKMAQ